MRALMALTVFGGGVAQATVVPALRIGDVAPDLPLILVVLLALRRGPELGGVAGFAMGLLQDTAGGGLIGVQALTKALIGFVVGSLAGGLRGTQPLVQVPGLALLTIVEGLLRYGLLKLFHFPVPFGELMLYVVLPQALYNGFLGAAVVCALVWVNTYRRQVS